MFGLGAGELFIIFVFALIFIGPKKLPELAKGLGKGIREFQKAKNEIMDEVNNSETEQQNNAQKKVADTTPQNESDSPSEGHQEDSKKDESNKA